MKHLRTFKTLAQVQNIKVSTPAIICVEDVEKVGVLGDYGEDVVITMSSSGKITILHEKIDLGLPSGTLWSNMNLGAESEEDCGKYYAWGESEGFTGEEINSGIRSFSENEYITPRSAEEVDCATLTLGEGWKIPGQSELEELLEYTTQIFENGGCRFKSKQNSESIFLPLAGMVIRNSIGQLGEVGKYWLSDYGTDFSITSDIRVSEESVYSGLSVRPVWVTEE